MYAKPIVGDCGPVLQVLGWALTRMCNILLLGLRQARVRARARLRILRWHGSHSAEVNKNINLAYRVDLLRWWRNLACVCSIPIRLHTSAANYTA